MGLPTFVATYTYACIVCGREQESHVWLSNGEPLVCMKYERVAGEFILSLLLAQKWFFALH